MEWALTILSLTGEPSFYPFPNKELCELAAHRMQTTTFHLTVVNPNDQAASCELMFKIVNPKKVEKGYYD